MSEAVVIREMRADEAALVSELSMRTFDAFVGNEFSAEGVAAYADYADADALLARHESDHFTLIALVEEDIAGMIEFRKNEHLSMLFVDPTFHRRGIARGLYDAALAQVLQQNPDLTEVTVNASRYAVPVYERLGFVVTGDEQTVNGITFVPMVADAGGGRPAAGGRGVAAAEHGAVRGDAAPEHGAVRGDAAPEDGTGRATASAEHGDGRAQASEESLP